MHIYFLPFHTHTERLFILHPPKSAYGLSEYHHLGCSFWAQHCTTGKWCQPGTLCLAQQLPLAELSYSLSYSALLRFARAHVWTLFLQLSPKLKILTFPFEFQSPKVLSSATGYILLAASQLTTVASKHSYVLSSSVTLYQKLFSRLLFLQQLIYYWKILGLS